MKKGKQLFFERYPSPLRMVVLSFLALILFILFLVGLATYKLNRPNFTMREYLSNLIASSHNLGFILFSIFILVFNYIYFFTYFKYGVYENGIEVSYRFVKWEDIAEIIEMKNLQIKSKPTDSIFSKLANFDLSWRYKKYRLIMFDKEVTYYGIHLKNGLFLIFPTTRKDDFENAVKQAGYGELLRRFF